MWFRNRNPDLYVIDTSRLSRELQVATCRAALELIAPDVDRFQCDVPWENSALWPDDVLEAAADLVPHQAEYETTGWITDFPESRWRSFVSFAPYAFGSDAWTADMNSLADVDDEGTALVVRVLPDQLRQFELSIPGADVVPFKVWKRRPRGRMTSR